MVLEQITVGSCVRATRELHKFVPEGAVGTVVRIIFDADGHPSRFRVHFQLQKYSGIYVTIEISRDAGDFEPA